MPLPKYEFGVIAELIEKGNYQVGYKRAVNSVIKYLNMTNEDAERFILKEVKKLTLENFSKCKKMNGEIYDVYGKQIKGIPWYIKLTIRRDEKKKPFLWQISFHPTEHELQTRSETLEKYEDNL